MSKTIAFAELVDAHYELIYRYAWRLSGSTADAEDLTQQTFLSAQQKLGQLRDGDKARHWLYTICRNAFLKSKRGPRSRVISLDESPEPIAVTDPEVIVEPQLLQQVLTELPEAFRTPLILFYFEEMSYREIADILNVPIGTVMSRLARAKTQLRGRLQREGLAATQSPATSRETR